MTCTIENWVPRKIDGEETNQAKEDKKREFSLQPGQAKREADLYW